MLLGPAGAGEYMLKWRVNSPGVLLEKTLLDMHGGVKDSYLGPPETKIHGGTCCELGEETLGGGSSK